MADISSISPQMQSILRQYRSKAGPSGRRWGSVGQALGSIGGMFYDHSVANKFEHDAIEGERKTRDGLWDQLGGKPQSQPNGNRTKIAGALATSSPKVTPPNPASSGVSSLKPSTPAAPRKLRYGMTTEQDQEVRRLLTGSYENRLQAQNLLKGYRAQSTPDARLARHTKQRQLDLINARIAKANRKPQDQYAMRDAAGKRMGLSGRDLQIFTATGKLPEAPSSLDQARTEYWRQKTSAIQGGNGKDGNIVNVSDPVWGLDARGNLVGPTAPPLTPSEVPGIVTTPKGSSDRFATKTNDGIRATAKATPEQQRRLLRHKQVQDYWTWANSGRPPKAGYVYNEKGQQVPSGALSVGAQNQKSQRAMIDNAIENIDSAVKTMLSNTMLGRATAANLDDYSVGRMVNSVTGGDVVAQAYRDYSQGVLAAVYAMSGKTTTNAEMERFLGMYMPQGGDGKRRIKLKQARIKQMLRAIQGGVERGLPYDEAERRALSLSRNTPQTPESSRAQKEYTFNPETGELN